MGKTRTSERKVLWFPGRELEEQLATEFYSHALVTRGERHTYMALGSSSPVICSEGQEPAALSLTWRSQHHFSIDFRKNFQVNREMTVGLNSDRSVVNRIVTPLS